MGGVPLMGLSKVLGTSTAKITVVSLYPWISCLQIVRVAPFQVHHTVAMFTHNSPVRSNHHHTVVTVSQFPGDQIMRGLSQIPVVIQGSLKVGLRHFKRSRVIFH